MMFKNVDNNMKKLMSCLCAVALATVAAEAENVLVEAEGFKDCGGWVLDQQFMDQMGSPYLLAHAPAEGICPYHDFGANRRLEERRFAPTGRSSCRR